MMIAATTWRVSIADPRANNARKIAVAAPRVSCGTSPRVSARSSAGMNSAAAPTKMRKRRSTFSVHRFQSLSAHFVDEDLFERWFAKLEPADAQLPQCRLQHFLRIGALGEAQLRSVVDNRCLTHLRQMAEERAVTFVVDMQRVAAERCAHLFERAFQHDFALMNEHDLVSHALRFTHHVRGKKNRAALVFEIA